MSFQVSFPPFCKGREGGAESNVEEQTQQKARHPRQSLPPLTHPYKGGESAKVGLVHVTPSRPPSA